MGSLLRPTMGTVPAAWKSLSLISQQDPILYPTRVVSAPTSAQLPHSWDCFPHAFCLYLVAAVSPPLPKGGLSCPFACPKDSVATEGLPWRFSSAKQCGESIAWCYRICVFEFGSKPAAMTHPARCHPVPVNHALQAGGWFRSCQP